MKWKIHTRQLKKLVIFRCRLLNAELNYDKARSSCQHGPISGRKPLRDSYKVSDEIWQCVVSTYPLTDSTGCRPARELGRHYQKERSLGMEGMGGGCHLRGRCPWKTLRLLEQLNWTPTRLPKNLKLICNGNPWFFWLFQVTVNRMGEIMTQRFKPKL